MNSHWLKQVYARMLKENTDPESLIKIFKQEDNETEVDHVATLKKTYFKNVVLPDLKKGQLISNLSYKKEIESVLSNFGASLNSSIGKEFAHIIAEFGLEFTESNINRCADTYLSICSNFDQDSLTNIITNSYGGSIKTGDSSLKELVITTGKAKSGGTTISVGKGEYAMGLFTGGAPVEGRGDLSIKKNIIEVKLSKNARIGGYIPGEILSLMKVAIDKKNIESIQDVLIATAGVGVTKTIEQEILSAANEYIIKNQEKILQMFGEKLRNETLGWKPGAISYDFFKYGVIGALKHYKEKDEFNYYVLIEETSPFRIKSLNVGASITDLYNDPKIKIIVKNWDRSKAKYSEGPVLEYLF